MGSWGVGQGGPDVLRSCSHSWHVFWPVGISIPQRNTIDSEPWHPGLQAWPPSVAVGVRRGVGLFWQTYHSDWGGACWGAHEVWVAVYLTEKPAVWAMTAPLHPVSGQRPTVAGTQWSLPAFHPRTPKSPPSFGQYSHGAPGNLLNHFGSGCSWQIPAPQVLTIL